MAAIDNPLRQYFRRPGVYIKLPSGIENYSDEDIEKTETGELPVYPMTAIDDITTKTPDSLFNGEAVVQLVKSCVPAIKNPWKILSTDLDSILIAIRAAGGQETIDVESECEKCKALGTYGIHLQTLLSSLKAGDYDKLLEYGDLKIKFKPLRYKEMNEAGLGQFEIQAKYRNLNSIKDETERNRLSQDALKDITILTMRILAKAIDYIETPNAKVAELDFIEDFLTNADTKTYETVRDYHSILRAESTIKPLEITCAECSHQYTQTITLNVSDFFG
jgi:hypothetical protein